jgi:hypothetical protein
MEKIELHQEIAVSVSRTEATQHVSAMVHPYQREISTFMHSYMLTMAHATCRIKNLTCCILINQLALTGVCMTQTSLRRQSKIYYMGNNFSPFHMQPTRATARDNNLHLSPIDGFYTKLQMNQTLSVMYCGLKRRFPTSRANTLLERTSTS